jgi:hypothetical protein
MTKESELKLVKELISQGKSMSQIIKIVNEEKNKLPGFDIFEMFNINK